MCCASFCFGLMLYVRAIVAPVESSTPSSPDINVKVRAEHDPRSSFLTIRQLLDSDGTVLLCLHEWGAHGHPSLMSPDHGTPGNGLLLFFRVDDFDLALQRARSLVTRLEEEPHVNPNTQTNEFSLRDPDGYYVSISALSAA